MVKNLTYYIGYNVHGLIHVSDFVLTHGALDLFSGFTVLLQYTVT